MDKQEKKRFRGSLLLSILLHIIIIGIFYIDFPISEKFPEYQNIITIESVPISSKVNIKTENKKPVPKEIVNKSKFVKESNPVKKIPPVRVTDEKKSNLKKPNKIEKKITIPKKEEKKIVKKVPVEKKKVANKEIEDPVDSILKNLEKESDGKDTKSTNKSSAEQSKGDKNTKGSIYDEELPLSITEELYIKKIIEQNWNPPEELRYSEGINLKILIELDKQGKIIHSRVNMKCPLGSANLCLLLEESVLRALKKVDTIENLLPERYNIWKSFILNYDSSFFN